MKLMRTGVIVILLAVLAACEGDTQANVPARALPMHHYIGAMHEHSGYSDGEIGTTPADYYDAGKKLGLDFMAGSEHSDNANLPVTANTDCLSDQLIECVDVSPDGFLKWNASADIAAALSDEQFTAVRGFEWTSDRYGHINVFFSQNDLNAKADLGYLVSMEPFWQWLGIAPSAFGGSDGLVVFNHPGREDMLHSACDNFGPLADTCGTIFNGDPAFTWNDFDYQPELAERVVGIEMYGKSNHYYDGDNGAPEGGWYAYALDKGWRLGPVGAEDEHGQEWGQPTRAKTVIIASENTPEALRQAMLERRFYALAHSYNHLRLHLSASNDDQDAREMGAQIEHRPGSVIDVLCSVEGLAAEHARIEFVGSGGQVLKAVDGTSARLQVAAAGEGREWVFARVRDLGDADGDEIVDEVVAVSAPIWFSQTPEAAAR